MKKKTFPLHTFGRQWWIEHKVSDGIQRFFTTLSHAKLQIDNFSCSFAWHPCKPVLQNKNILFKLNMISSIAIKLFYLQQNENMPLNCWIVFHISFKIGFCAASKETNVPNVNILMIWSARLLKITKGEYVFSPFCWCIAKLDIYNFAGYSFRRPFAVPRPEKGLKNILFSIVIFNRNVEMALKAYKYSIRGGKYHNRNGFVDISRVETTFWVKSDNI